VLSAGRFDVEPVLLEALVDLIDVRLATNCLCGFGGKDAGNER
jgi:hypothetical protein